MPLDAPDGEGLKHRWFNRTMMYGRVRMTPYVCGGTNRLAIPAGGRRAACIPLRARDANIQGALVAL